MQGTEREMARESILSSRKKRETATVENKQTQMKLLKKNRKVYVSLYGQKAYDKKLGELLTACLAADNVNDNYTNLDNSDGEEQDAEEEVSTGEMEEGSSGGMVRKCRSRRTN